MCKQEENQKLLFSTYHQQTRSDLFLGRKVSAPIVVTPEGKHCK